MEPAVGGLGLVHVLVPPGRPRHPLAVLARMGQRHACIGFPSWAARQDVPGVRPLFEVALDLDFHLLGAGIQTLLGEVMRGEHQNAERSGSMFRALARDLGRNVLAMRRRTNAAMRLAPLGSWDGPRRIPRREDEHLMARVVAAYEGQRWPGMG